MSKTAEQKANKRWPVHPWSIFPKEGEHGEIINFDEWLEDFRLWVQSFSLNAGYKEGYEQAEKDMIHIVKTWLSEIHRVCDITDENGYRIELRNLTASFEKTLKEE